MESSIAEFLKRQSACELLPTDPFPSVQYGGLPVMGQIGAFRRSVFTPLMAYPCGRGSNTFSDIQHPWWIRNVGELLGIFPLTSCSHSWSSRLPPAYLLGLRPRSCGAVARVISGG